MLSLSARQLGRQESQGSLYTPLGTEETIYYISRIGPFPRNTRHFLIYLPSRLGSLYRSLERRQDLPFRHLKCLFLVGFLPFPQNDILGSLLD